MVIFSDKREACQWVAVFHRFYVANIYMEFFERYLLPSIGNFKLVWLRYVNDVFAVLPDIIDLDNFLASLNRLSHSIKITIEKKSTNTFFRCRGNTW